IPAFLSIRNPLEHDFGGELFDPDDVERVIRQARREGHDGVIIRNIRNFEGGDTSTTYIVFEPEQVKSAIGNRGTFDPSSPNILEQRAFHGSPHRFDRFSLQHIGTGEGAQAFGWGLYFAEN